MDIQYPLSLRRWTTTLTLAIAGVTLPSLSHAQVFWDATDSDGASGDGVYWNDSGNWIGGSLPGTGQDIYLDGSNIVVDGTAVYRHVTGGSGGTIAIDAGGMLSTYGSYSAVRNLGSVTVGAGGLLIDANDDSAAIRSNTYVETGGRTEGFEQTRDNDITLNGGSFAPLGTNTSNKRNFTINSNSGVYINSGQIELDVFGDDDSEYFNLSTASSQLNLSGTNGGSILLVPQNGYVPQVGDSFDLWDNTGSGTVTAGDASNVSLLSYNAVFDTSAWASTGVLTIDAFLSGAVVIYASDFETDESGSPYFFVEPASLTHNPTASHAGTEDGAMVFGAPGESWVTFKMRIPAEEGEQYEVVARSALLGTGSNTDDHYIRLIKADGTIIESSSDLGSGDHQVLLPSTGTAPADTAYVELYWQIRGSIATGTTKHIEIYQVEVTQLGPEGPRPFYEQIPYIQHILGYVNEEVTIDLTDCFSGTVSNYTNDAGIPMTFSGDVLTFSPTATQALTSMQVFAENSAGVSVQGVVVKLQVDAEPATLAANTGLDTAVHEQLDHQYVEPGQHLFPIDCDLVFTEGLPPYTYTIISAPSWVEMPVNGLIGGKCPTSATPSSTSIVIQSTDARSDTATYTLDLDVIAARDRTPTHYPTDNTSFQAAIATGGNVVQLATNTAYNLGNMYGKALTTSSTEDPVIILGASGATINQSATNNSGHFIFENVAFVLDAETDLLSVKKTRGMRLVNCTFEGYEVVVDLEDSTPWVTTDEFRYVGGGLSTRENTYIVLEGCHFEKLNTSFSASVNTKSFGMYDTTSELVADDHCFFQQSRAIWLEDVNLLGHAGNHTTGEHRDIIQLANPNQPPNRHVLLRHVFGYGDGKSQGLFIENEDQRIDSSRIPYWPGNHRDVLIDNCAFVANSQNGISLRGLLGVELRNSAIIGHPDEYYSGSTPAFGKILIREWSENGVYVNNISDYISIEDAAENAHTNHTYTNNLVLNDLSGGYASNRTAIFPDFNNTSLTMKERLTMDSTWATNNLTLGPDILRP